MKDQIKDFVFMVAAITVALIAYQALKPVIAKLWAMVTGRPCTTCGGSPVAPTAVPVTLPPQREAGAEAFTDDNELVFPSVN